MTLTVLLARVRLRIGADSSDALHTDANLTADLTDALDAIAEDGDWNWLITTRSVNTAAATRTIALHASWMRTISLQIDTYQPLEAVAKRELDRMYPSSTEKGYPRHYAIAGGSIYLGPIPDAVYALTETYVQKDTDLSSGSDESLMPPTLHPAIVDLACSYALQRAGAMDEAAAYAARYTTEWLPRIRRRDKAASSRGSGVAIRPGAWL